MKSLVIDPVVEFGTSPPARVVWIEINSFDMSSSELLSPPARVVWIEIRIIRIEEAVKPASPPARVVWIEIVDMRFSASAATGRHPRGWCGLKSERPISPVALCLVATREGGVD